MLCRLDLCWTFTGLCQSSLLILSQCQAPLGQYNQYDLRLPVLSCPTFEVFKTSLSFKRSAANPYVTTNIHPKLTYSQSKSSLRQKRRVPAHDTASLKKGSLTAAFICVSIANSAQPRSSGLKVNFLGKAAMRRCILH